MLTTRSTQWHILTIPLSNSVLASVDRSLTQSLIFLSSTRWLVLTASCFHVEDADSHAGGRQTLNRYSAKDNKIEVQTESAPNCLPYWAVDEIEVACTGVTNAPKRVGRIANYHTKNLLANHQFKASLGQ